MVTGSLIFLLGGQPAGASRPAAPDPGLGAELQPLLENKLSLAFAVASERVLEVPSCRKLFTDLGRDAAATLRVTRYFQAPLIAEQRICRHKVSAYTAVGSPATHLCRSFSYLAVDRAAVVLLHEALHYAGMTESPADPEALTSADINRLVEKSCRF